MHQHPAPLPKQLLEATERLGRLDDALSFGIKCTRFRGHGKPGTFR